MKNLIHIYTGDGKGKTTAAVGLTIRYAGSGGKVLFSQFLKDNKSSELCILKRIDEIEVVLCQETFGFYSRMDEETKRKAKEVYSIYPNPSNGSFTLAVNKAVQSGSVVITDMAGRVTERRDIKSALGANEAFNLENTAPGNYLVVLTLDGAVYREKVSIW